MTTNDGQKDLAAGGSLNTHLPRELQGQIGKKLREHYTELIHEPVPDRFVELLQQLKNKEAKTEGGERER